MKKILCIYNSDARRTVFEEYTFEEFLFVNEGFEDFVNDVWQSCETNGYYDDSDRPHVICMYFAVD